jgi:hypothetical protein
MLLLIGGQDKNGVVIITLVHYGTSSKWSGRGCRGGKDKNVVVITITQHGTSNK